METFVKVGKSVVNASRVIAVQHKSGKHEGVFQQDEHYLVTFDSGKELWLTPEEGGEFIDQHCGGAGKGAEGMIATTSDVLT